MNNINSCYDLKFLSEYSFINSTTSQFYKNSFSNILCDSSIPGSEYIYFMEDAKFSTNNDTISTYAFCTIFPSDSVAREKSYEARKNDEIDTVKTHKVYIYKDTEYNLLKIEFISLKNHRVKKYFILRQCFNTYSMIIYDFELKNAGVLLIE